MSKPLTIDELKALQAGDWVWWVDKLTSEQKYVQIRTESHKDLFNAAGSLYPYSCYGIAWLAYKNKEQAETKGEIIELPCLRDKPPIGCKDSPIRVKELNYMTDDGTICSQLYLEDEFDEAERRLAELKGEKK